MKTIWSCSKVFVNYSIEKNGAFSEKPECSIMICGIDLTYSTLLTKDGPKLIKYA